jgi:hypothetical protein
MGLFLYASDLRKSMSTELYHVQKCCGELVPIPVHANDIRHAVRALCNHDVVVVSTDVAMLTPNVQRLQQIAHLMGIRVVPLANYISGNAKARERYARIIENAPVAASAVPPTQHPAAAGQPIAPRR